MTYKFVSLRRGAPQQGVRSPTSEGAETTRGPARKRSRNRAGVASRAKRSGWETWAVPLACVAMAVAAVASLGSRTLDVPVSPSALTTSSPPGLAGLAGAHPALDPGSVVTSEVDLSATASRGLAGVVLEVVPSGWSPRPPSGSAPTLSVAVRSCSGAWAPAPAGVPSSGAAVCRGSAREVASAVVGRVGGELLLAGLAGLAGPRPVDVAHLQVALEVPTGTPGGTRPTAVHLAFVTRTGVA